MVDKTRQFFALGRKNLWMKKRRWALTLLEYAGGFAWLVMATYLAYTMLHQSQETPALLDPPAQNLPHFWNTTTFLGCLRSINQTCDLAIVPDNNLTRSVVGPAIQLNLGFPVTLVYFENETLLENFYNDNYGAIWNALVFLSPDFTEYAIRTNATYLPQSDNSASNSNPFSFLNTILSNTTLYVDSGVLLLQQAVDMTLMELALKKPLPNIQTQIKSLPQPVSKISFESLIGIFVPPLYLLGFMPNFLMSLVSIVGEKATKVKEYMKMMGLSESVYILSWFVTVAVPMILLAMFLVIINFAFGVFEHSSIGLLILFYLAFAFTLVGFCFLAASFTDTTRTAILIGALWLYVLSTFNIFLPSLGASVKYGVSFLAPLGFSLGYSLILKGESQGGVTFSNPIVDDVSLIKLLFVLILDSIIYFVLAWYISNVRPGEWGNPKPFNFCFTPSYWKSVFGRADKNSFDMHNPAQDRKRLLSGKSRASEPIVEESHDDHERKESVRITGLTKIFNESDGAAVDDLSLSLYRNEIFVLLGHNGAGKTTTIGMLTGLLPPTEGGAAMEGYRLPEQIDEIRQMIGVCPQHDILWDNLTAAEHLRLFAYLKGVPDNEIESSVSNLLTKVGMERSKWDQITAGYSGGTKRKLSLAIALIGDSKVVFLDEPTSGMDPVSRRFMYTFLDEAKKDKTIILTTHNMEEADILGDRVAILARGQLQCCGSSLFLKSKFGVGYYLSIAKTDEEQGNKLLAVVKRLVPNASLKSETAASLELLLPLENIQQFSLLFAELEQLTSEKVIHHFSISMTTLEDVFLKIASEESLEKQSKRVVGDKKGKRDSGFTQISIDSDQSSTPLMHKGGLHLPRHKVVLKQMKPLFRKKWLTTTRNIRFLLILFLMPAVLVTLNLISFKFTKSLVNADVSTNDTLIAGVSSLNVTTLPYTVLDPNNSTESLIDNLIQLTGDPGLFQSYASIGDLETYVLGNYFNITAGGGFILNNVDLSSQTFETTVLYNSSISMSLPTYLNLMHNAIFQQLLGPNVSIITHIHPLPGTSPVVLFSSVSVSIFIGLSLLLGAFGRELVQERTSMVKWQMLLASMDVIAYWASHLLADWLTMLIPTIVIWITLVLFDDTDYLGNAFVAFVILCFMFQLSSLLCQYVLSMFFAKPDNVLVIMHLVNLLSGFLPYVVYIALTAVAAASKSSDTANLLDNIAAYIVLPFPTATFLAGLQDLQNLGSNYGSFGLTVPLDALFSWKNNVTKRFLFFGIQIIVFFCMLVYFEKKSLKILQTPMSRPAHNVLVATRQQPEDPDVAKERERVQHGTNDSIAVNQLSKSYGDQLVVNNISLGIPKGECFGLLGPNGAGKTTSIGMMTGQAGPAGGTISLEGNITVNTDQQDLYSRIRLGCCLQADSLIDLMTGREHLELFCRLRRDMFHLTDHQVHEVIDNWMEEMKLVPYENRISQAYSGGNKRKLCVSIAMLLDNRLVFLDEPSSGMDPDARRALWKVIANARDGSDRQVVLTTHSMEEAEAVCDRIGIIVSGRINCLGATQHLKNRFGFGYRLLMKTTENMGVDPEKALEKQHKLMQGIIQDDIHNFIKKIFPNAVLLEALGGQRSYELGHVESLSRAFHEIEEHKRELGILEYSITQNSLEQVFMYFAKFQKTEEK